jgi:pyrroline-5-carboxylate reductase
MNDMFGFIGTGNMGGALARACAQAVLGEKMLLSDGYAPVAEKLAAELGCKATAVNEVAEKANFIFLGVKPQVMGDMLAGIAPVLAARKEGFTLVSMAAGLSMEKIRKMAGGNYPVIRIMPNIPVKVGSGVILYDATENVSKEALSAFRSAMTAAGLVDRLPEKLIDAGSAVSGCGPAFVALFAEALADGGVECGLPRDKALRYALQTIAGTAEYLLESGVHPAMLKDQVCSPGGTTIAGVHAMELGGFRAASAEAVICAYQKTLELGK